jgi:hypothetical protein
MHVLTGGHTTDQFWDQKCFNNIEIKGDYCQIRDNLIFRTNFWSID